MFIFVRKQPQFIPRTIPTSSGLTDGSTRTDNPLNTQIGLIQTLLNPSFNSFNFGKIPTSTHIGRGRLGVSIPLDTRYWGGTTYKFAITLDNFADNWESPTSTVGVCISNTDDSGLYTTSSTKAAWDWEANISGGNGVDISVGTGYYIGDLVWGTTTQQTIVVPTGIVMSALGAGNAHLSFVISTNYDLLGTGQSLPASGKSALFQCSAIGGMILS